MKFRNLGRVSLALAASLVLAFGTESCHYDYTEAYIIVTGSQYNQIASYREQEDTGILFAAPGDPQSSGGQDPIRAVLLQGGRYVYVLNHGKPTVGSDGATLNWTGGNISVFSIGGDGSLAYQLSYPSQGNGSIRIATSGANNFLYVLDEYGPTGAAGTTGFSTTKTPAYPCYDSTYNVYRPVGDVTVFSIDNSTGRLYLVQNQEQQDASGTDLNYFPVGCGPIDFLQASGYLYTAESSDPSNPNDVPGQNQVIYPYQAASTGQLLQAPGGSQSIGNATTNITALGASTSGNWVYVLDSGNNNIYVYTPGGNGLLSAISGGTAANDAGTSDMTAMTTDSSSKFLYIANAQSPALGFAGSAISAFEITPSTGDLTTPVPEQPFGTGAGPVCIFEDPSHQYLYTADAAASTITGSAINPETGILKNLSKGSTFATVGTPTWCLYSSNTD